MGYIPGNLFERQCVRNIKCKKFRLNSASHGTSPNNFQQEQPENRLNFKRDK